MREISANEVSDLAKLARLGLSAEEKETLAIQMTEVLNFASELEAVNTSNTVPTSQVSGLVNVFRDDKDMASPITREELLSNAPGIEAGSIKVKKVL